MKLSDYARLSVLMTRLARFSPDRPPHPKVAEQLDLDAGGAPYDLYEPRHGAPRQTLIAVHGASRPGGKDPRMVHFGRCLARSGITCAVPHLEGVASCRWDTRDLDHLAAVVDRIATSAEAQVGLLGFSYGGSYSLVVAARPELATRIRFVLTIGAFYSLTELFGWYQSRQEIEPSGEKEWDFEIYKRLVLAYQYRASLPLPRSLWPEMEALIWGYCDAASADYKRAFYDSHLRDLDPTELGWRDSDPEVMAALSPAGKLAGLTAFVGVVHDRDDVVVPPEQGERIYAELCRRSAADPRPAANGSGGARDAGAAGQQLVVTSLVSHVSPSNMWRLGELRRFSAVLSPIVGA